MRQRQCATKAAGWRPVKRLLVLVVWLPVLLFAPPLVRAADAAGQTVPIMDGCDMIIVPVHAFDRTLNFIVDTGFSLSAIDNKYASWLGNQVDAYTAISALGVKRDVPVYLCPDLSVGGKPAGLTDIMRLDLTMLGMITGQPCDGILGKDWFANNVVSIDFVNKTLTLETETPEVVKRTFTPVALGLAGGLYTMKATLNQRKTIDLVVDTGDSGSVSLNQDAWQDIFSTNQSNTVGATVADAVNNVAQTKIGVVGQVSVAGLTYTNLHALLIKNPLHPSRLGLRFFQRHNVTFDFAEGLLYLQPNQNFGVPDTEDMSGLHLLRDGQKTIVYSVSEASPAAAQGIRARDVIETVNQQPAASLKIQAIRDILRAGDGQLVALQIRRGDSLLSVRIALKKTI